MKNSVAIVMGVLHNGKTAVYGETMKNQYIIDGIKPFSNKMIVSDFMVGTSALSHRTIYPGLGTLTRKSSNTEKRDW